MSDMLMLTEDEIKLDRMSFLFTGIKSDLRESSHGIFFNILNNDFSVANLK